MFTGHKINCSTNNDDVSTIPTSNRMWNHRSSTPILPHYLAFGCRVSITETTCLFLLCCASDMWLSGQTDKEQELFIYYYLFSLLNYICSLPNPRSEGFSPELNFRQKWSAVQWLWFQFRNFLCSDHTKIPHKQTYQFT